MVPNTEPNLKSWIGSLAHIPFQAGQLIIDDYYGKHLDPEQRKPITPAHIRKLYSSRVSMYGARDRALNPPERERKGSGAPRWFIERMQTKHGHLKDRDPNNYQ